MTTTRKHETDVDDQRGYCTCGWVGLKRRSDWQAEADTELHKSWVQYFPNKR